MRKKIVCMGSVNMDLCMHMQIMPNVGETIRTDNFATYPGGKAGNQAAAAGELGGNVCVLARLGDDAFSTQLTDELKRHGVQTNSLIYEQNATAGIAMIRIDAQGRNSISFTPGANAAISPQLSPPMPSNTANAGILLPETISEYTPSAPWFSAGSDFPQHQKLSSLFVLTFPV